MKNGNVHKHDEAVGLFYGGFVIIGSAVGALIGFIISGGGSNFLSGGWISVIVGAVIGFFLGIGAGLISHGVITVRRKNE